MSDDIPGTLCWEKPTEDVNKADIQSETIDIASMINDHTVFSRQENYSLDKIMISNKRSKRIFNITIGAWPGKLQSRNQENCPVPRDLKSPILIHSFPSCLWYIIINYCGGLTFLAKIYPQ